MEQVYSCTEKRTKCSVAKAQLSSMGWGQTERTAFDACKDALSNQAKLAYRGDKKHLCFYSDASDTVWSCIVTQVHMSDLCLLLKEQRHQPLAFLSGLFNCTQLGWSTLEKGAFAILARLDRIHWLCAGPQGFVLYTEHNNLIFLFNPLMVVPDLSQTALRKVLRWAVCLSPYAYTCMQIKGDDNIWADLPGRWSVSATVQRLVNILKPPFSAADTFI